MMKRKNMLVILLCLILVSSILLFININQKNKLESYIGNTEAFLIGQLDHILNDIIINGDEISITEEEYNSIKKELVVLNTIISSHKHLESLSIYIDEHIIMDSVNDINIKDLKELRKFIYNSIKTDEKNSREYYNYFKNNSYLIKEKSE